MAAVQTARAGACDGTEASAARVTRIGDGRTLSLSDGREILLAGISLPLRSEEQAARAAQALQFLLQTEVRVLESATGPDRYGRREAYVFIERAGTPRLVQELLLEQGHVLALPRPPGTSCSERLARSEATARDRKLGLWGVPGYATLSANDPAGILGSRGRFAIVQGKILSVRESGGLIYLNFGRRWSEDFTAAVLKRNEGSFTVAGMELKRLEGRTVRIRGWIEARGGPWIETSDPRQIEILPHR